MTTSLRPDHIQGRNPKYVNHVDELAKAVSMIERAAGSLVLVFLGVAGVGKTATARELAFRVKHLFPDGVLFADLSGALEVAGAEAEILKIFLTELGVPPGLVPDRLAALRARYQSITAGKRVLVLVDGAVRASQVRTLLPGDGRSLVLVTAGQSVPDLAVDTDVRFFDLSPLTEEAAVELLQRLLGEDRVAAEREAVGELIVLCGHLPIALCVAASMLQRPRNRTVASTVERLRDERRRLSVLSPPTDLSVASTFTAAFRQLGDSAQRCYQALGLAPRTGRANAEALAAALELPSYDVAESLAELFESSFIEEIGQDRYTVNDLVALHASYMDDRQPQAKNAESARLVEFYHQQSIDADAVLAPNRPWRKELFPELRPRGKVADARAWFEGERRTLTKFVEYAFDQEDLERVCSWCVVLWPFYEAGKHIGDLLATHELGIQAALMVRNPAWESLIRTQKGFGHLWLGELDQAAALFEEAAGLAPDAELEATAVEGLGLCLLEMRSPEALPTLRRNLELAQEIRDDRRIALARLHLAKAETPDAALALLTEAAQHFATKNDEVNQHKCATWLGKHLSALGRPDEAAPLLERAVEFMAGRGRRFDQAEALVPWGDVRAEDARDCWNEAASIYEDLGFTARAAEVRARL